MDSDRFDDLVKRLAVGASRRKFLKGIGGGAVAGAVGLVRQRGSSAQAPGKVQICHLTGSETNPVVLIEVSVNAIPAHQAHGDVIAPDFENDPENCGGCLISCDDADPCTIDTCVAGECVNTPIVCDDGNVCTDDACVEGACVFTPVPGRECDDGSACTENDACDATGACVGTPVDCDDGDACTVDGCDPASGCTHTPLDCDDDNACTIDRCDSATGCVHEPVNCDDGDPCTIDSCDPAGGCRHDPVVCGPGEVCFGGECVGTCPDGGSCSTGFPVCDDPAKDCVCFAAVGGLNLCVFPRACAVVLPCDSHDDCPDGEFCLVNDCCDGTCGLPCPEGITLAAASVAEDGGPNQAGR